MGVALQHVGNASSGSLTPATVAWIFVGYVSLFASLLVLVKLSQRVKLSTSPCWYFSQSC
jgi:hypothetical protein